MQRRDFIGRTALGSAAIITGPALGSWASELGSDMLHERTVAQLQAAMHGGLLTSKRLVRACLERAAALDSSGPTLRALIEVNPEAIALARQLDDERQAGGSRGPLHGIPLVIKDNIDTADQLMTTAGSLALVGHRASRDAPLVTRLRQAGAIILAKANLSEWANMRSTRSSSGWSSRGGQTRNPYALDRTPCGSSSGSAVAVAAGLCPLSVGTETDGSIVCPAASNSVVGIKPTVGLISGSGIIPISHTQDTAGPMGRTVADAAVLLGVLEGPDSADPNASRAARSAGVDYTRFLDRDALRGARIGVVRSMCTQHEGVLAVLEQALKVMRDQGAVIVDEVAMDSIGELGEPEFEVLKYEFKDGLNRYLATVDGDMPVHTLAELIDYNAAHEDRIMPYFRQEVLEQSQAMGPLTDAAYRRAESLARELSRDRGTDAALAEHHLDALLAPTHGPPGLTDLVLGDHGVGGSSSAAAAAGYPAITVPAGYVFGLPVGISLWSTAYREGKLISLAYAFEQAAQLREPPRFLATAAV
jgi:amidase